MNGEHITMQDDRVFISQVEAAEITLRATPAWPESDTLQQPLGEDTGNSRTAPAPDSDTL
jgi:hypothetical protein